MNSQTGGASDDPAWERPSDRLRVLELGSWLAAPGAGALLVDLGADVVKVEPVSGDPGRHFVAALGGTASDTPSFALLNRGKRSLALNLGNPAERVIFDRLLARADVFLTNLRPSSLDRLGLSPEALAELYPRLVVAVMTGLGRRGAERDRAAYDVGGFWSRSGLMRQLTPEDQAPPSPTGGYGDIVTSLALYAGILSALWRRERTGAGGIVETSLLQAGAFVMAGDLAVQAAHGHVPRQMARPQCRTPMVNSYRSRDGQWFFLTGIEARRHFVNVCRAIERDDLVDDPRFGSSQAIRKHCHDLVAVFDDAFARADMASLAERFEASSVLWQPVTAPAAVLNDPQLTDNAMLKPIINGDAVVPMVTTPFDFGEEFSVPRAAPTVGQHNIDFGLPPGSRGHRDTPDAAST
jgi:crotonobetainyl-CoA:carnitine CoA-transferase CaiB-like acyl-CoA transferase